MISTLPVLMALSWMPVISEPSQDAARAPAPLKSSEDANTAATITCPITGKEIPACCCPAK